MDESIASLGHSRFVIGSLRLMDLTMTSVLMPVQVSSASAVEYMLYLFALTLLSVFCCPIQTALISLWLYIFTPLLVLLLVSCVTI